jgi:ATP-dependent Clp protease ATP-binding subunit ClpA
MAIEDAARRPRWLKDLIRFLPLKSQFLLTGNVRDLQLTSVGSDGYAAVPLLTLLADELRAAGYANVVFYDPAGGFRLANGTDARVLEALGAGAGTDGRAPAGTEAFAETLRRVGARGAADPPIALIADFASQMINRSEALSTTEHALFTQALVLSHQARARPHGTPPRPFFNSVIWIANREADLPDFLTVANPRLRHIPVGLPDHRYRRALASSLMAGVDGTAAAAPAVREAALDELVEQTEGLLLLDLNAIIQLSRTEGIAVTKLGEAVRRYKVGVTEDPWAIVDRDKIRNGESFIRARVKGQDHAVAHILDIIKRAVSGVGAPRRGNRPRGVVFLAGPTGVGKTELAKSITQLLFGDDSAYIRFDMSEFSAEHSDQRLIGAPPGYVGYDAGGELTNAVREKPFSVVLFDEIEKAHPRILDKFLQVLDDGVLTSGRGDRVYFSEAFICFTSNLGVYRLDASGERVPNVTPEDDVDEVQRKIRAEIVNHFTVALNRPELLNRIGDNILIFDYVRPSIARAIYDGMVRSILDDCNARQGIEVVLSEPAQDALRGLCLADLSNGGRGIRNRLEAHLVNPLGRTIFDGSIASGTTLVVRGIQQDATHATIFDYVVEPTQR